MSDESVSQAEIDALVKGFMGGDETPVTAAASGGEINKHLEQFVAAAGEALTDLVGVPCKGVLRDVNNSTLLGVGSLVVGNLLAGSSALTSGLTGMVYYIMPEYVGMAIITQLYGGVAPSYLDEASLGALSEGLTQMNQSGFARVADVLGRPVTASPVEALALENVTELPNAIPSANVVVVGFDITVGDVTGRILALFPQEVAQAVVQAAKVRSSAKSRPAGESGAAAGGGGGAHGAGSSGHGSAGGGTGGALVAQRSSDATPHQGGGSGSGVAYQSASFPELPSRVRPEDIRNIELLMDVGLQLTVELGRTRRQIRDVLALGPGSVVELDKLAGEQVDVLVNGKLIAKGEVVVIDENYGVRISDIVSPADRVQSLK